MDMFDQTARRAGNHRGWYDGSLYSLLIDPFLEDIRQIIADQVPAGSRVLDVACGTGALALRLAEKCPRVVGVDLSQRMISFAREKRRYHPAGNPLFLHGDAARLTGVADESFDFALISLALHEIPPGARLDVLRGMNTLARQIIVTDYHVPRRGGAVRALHGMAEFLAGWSHYRHYRDFVASGGVPPLFRAGGISLIQEIPAGAGIYSLFIGTSVPHMS